VVRSEVSRIAAGALVSMVAVALPLLGAGVANAAAPTAAEVVVYDASAAGDWSANVTAAVANWNSAEHNVQLVAGTPGTATVKLVDDPGWPETSTGSPGEGTVYLGQEAVDEGYDKTRITAHELGHILGLPDNYNGDCTLLMSGHSAGTACTSAVPASAEAAEVDEIFASTATTHRPAAQHAVLTRTVF
jgi:snapalysin